MHPLLIALIIIAAISIVGASKNQPVWQRGVSVQTVIDSEELIAVGCM